MPLGGNYYIYSTIIYLLITNYVYSSDYLRCQLTPGWPRNEVLCSVLCSCHVFSSRHVMSLCSRVICPCMYVCMYVCVYIIFKCVRARACAGANRIWFKLLYDILSRVHQSSSLTSSSQAFWIFGAIDNHRKLYCVSFRRTFTRVRPNTALLGAG